MTEDELEGIRVGRDCEEEEEDSGGRKEEAEEEEEGEGEGEGEGEELMMEEGSEDNLVPGRCICILLFVYSCLFSPCHL